MKNNNDIIYDSDLLDSLEEAFFAIKQMPNKLMDAMRLNPNLQYYSFEDSTKKLESLYTKIQKYEIEDIQKKFEELEKKYNGYLRVVESAGRGLSSVNDVNNYHASILVPWFEENILNFLKSKVKPNDNKHNTSIVQGVIVHGANSGVINTGNHNKIDVNITTTNNELENLLDELKAEINQIKAKLSDTDKIKIDKHLARLEADINENDEDEVKGSLEKISKIASIVEAGGKILEYKEKIIEFLCFGG